MRVIMCARRRETLCLPREGIASVFTSRPLQLTSRGGGPSLIYIIIHTTHPLYFLLSHRGAQSHIRLVKRANIFRPWCCGVAYIVSLFPLGFHCDETRKRGNKSRHTLLAVKTVTMAELVSDRSKKSSVTQLVHSTIGLGLLKPAETAVPSSILSSPEEDNGAMASSSSSRLHFYTKRSAGGSVSSEKAAGLDPDSDGGLTSLDAAGGRRRGKGRLPHQPSQDG